MRLFILFGLAVACVMHSVAQQVSGGKNYQPRVAITNSFHDGSSPAIGFMGGLETNRWLNSAELGGDFSTINNFAGTQVRYSGTIKSAHIWIAGTGTIKINLWRPTGTNVASYITNMYNGSVVAGTNYIDFSPDVEALEGDTIQIYIASAVNPKVKVTAGNGARYTAAEQTGQNYTHTTATANRINIAVYGDAPTLAFAGDSIISPWPWGFTAGVGVDFALGASTNGITSILKTLGWTTPSANFAYQDKTFEWVNTNEVTQATNAGITRVAVAAGVNDVAAGTTWANVLTNLNSIRAKVSGTLIVSEILPWTAGSDANALTIRTWNTNLSVWCATSSATLFQIHDAMGQTRGSTGQLDDLATAYDLDGIHLTTAGRTNYARRWMTVLP